MSQKLPRNFILFAVGPIVVGTVAMRIVERKTKLIQKVGVIAVWWMGRGCNAAGGLSLLQYTWWKTRLTHCNTPMERGCNAASVLVRSHVEGGEEKLREPLQHD
ncbi:hypothetical protein EDD16DRAFT_1519356 [Pisolithus croceorrhizus]|nr:hypothetical protein EDD16DRAFT_1519356 [Pisolithus croceorrhizus]KAI6120379.1 hypothetical protein EV401DRAFT_1887663 [Pisolithus croceorrhizus]KAI6166320.1 hypothetical protein EDD17DRAFT_1505241 [Pisolithus thermaeus]